MPEESLHRFHQPAAGSWIAVGLDFGLRRIGVAAGDSVTRRARPVTTLLSGATGPDWPGIARILADLHPGIAVVGIPWNVDGTAGTLTEPAQRFARELAERHSIRVDTIDERYSSLEAAEHLRQARQSGQRTRRVRREHIDAASACVILERWFDGLSPPVGTAEPAHD